MNTTTFRASAPTAAFWPRRAGLLLLVLLGLSLPGRAQWALQPFSYDSPEVFPYYFGVVDANVVWAVGYDLDAANRSVALTTTGGQSWALRTVTPLLADETINSITASSASSAWLTTQDGQGGGRLLHTADGGLTWTVQLTAGSPFNFVRFFSATNGVAVADPARPGNAFDISVTSDGGATWRFPTTVQPAGAGESGTILPPAVVGTTIWFTSDLGKVYKSVDQGVNWTVATVASNNPETYAVAFSDAQRGVVLNANGSTNQLFIYATTDGGATWQLQPYTGPAFSAGMAGVPGTGLLVSVGAGDLGPNDVGSSYSRDNGVSWVPIETTQFHTGVAAFSGSAVWSGAVLPGPALFLGQGVYRLPGTALAGRPQQAAPAALAYPNPSAADGELHLPLPASSATLRLTDALGREVWRTATPGGQPELRLSLRRLGLSPGLYVLTLDAAGSSTRQKLVLR